MVHDQRFVVYDMDSLEVINGLPFRKTGFFRQRCVHSAFLKMNDIGAVGQFVSKSGLPEGLDLAGEKGNSFGGMINAADTLPLHRLHIAQLDQTGERAADGISRTGKFCGQFIF